MLQANAGHTVLTWYDVDARRGVAAGAINSRGVGG